MQGGLNILSHLERKILNHVIPQADSSNTLLKLEVLINWFSRVCGIIGLAKQRNKTTILWGVFNTINT